MALQCHHFKLILNLSFSVKATTELFQFIPRPKILIIKRRYENLLFKVDTIEIKFISVGPTLQETDLEVKVQGHMSPIQYTMPNIKSQSTHGWTDRVITIRQLPLFVIGPN